MDHAAILGSTLRHIAGEKAAIAKKGVPLVTQKYPVAIAAAVAEIAVPRGARLMARGEAWDAALYEGQLAFRRFGDEDPLKLPLPKLPGQHQLDNAALAVAMLKAQDQLVVPDSALRSAMGWVQWPARLQRLPTGPLADALPQGSELIVDGGHNPAAGKALAQHVAQAQPAMPLHLVVGMLATKDHAGFLRSFPRGTRMTMVPVSGHASTPAGALAQAAASAGMVADEAADLPEAMRHVEAPSRVLITGSLHLAGDVLRLNGPLPA